ncbi:Txe/YoeB family addiction module toxin [Hydrogenimonas thermophila]|uniref:Toxin YoeB n=1 Tax=Hydrogenimonas thermophila TaxID=223786 RepID=A0A1I5SU35_9BACT|nr:Txe/YoeB family addiction module toxin [Hydrogenimonas thermophila]WOE70247.1 Txe/YoeB family addiction module toxin [Hydrogenimonas thermophila]WOE72764.1 Txe/YoeB family addiction module toxin [Hydrogenimonas thermophila]SFP74027.1 toxin YoeB [Hydrogenimonas thermophila]HIP29414.1 Txe/YoeB family addiction module toxin [Sulfurospirillum arcachonense]
MNLVFAEQAWEDYLYWQQQDKKILKRINLLIKEIKRDPFNGIGDPEPLRYNWSGYWSRRITREHRLVYKVVENEIWIAQCRYHY